MTPPLSVILPVHDGMPYLAESVRSILDQSFADFELVIGDDGSRDGSAAVLEGFAAQDSRIRLLRRPQPSGLAASAAWLAAEARAPLIAVAHADDRAHPDRLARQMAVAAHPGIVLVGTLWDGIDEAGRRIRPADHWRLLRPSRLAPFSHSSILFRKDAFLRAGGYRPAAEYWEDLDLYYRLARQGRIAVIPESLSTVRHSRISTKFRRDPERFERAVDHMYRASAVYAAGGVPDDALAPPGAKLNPMVFVSWGSTLLWSGRRPHVLGRMLRRARLGADAATLHALIWLVWAEISPATLRGFLCAILSVRNAIARPRLRGRAFVEWAPVAGAGGGDARD